MSNLNSFFDKRKEENLTKIGYENNLNLLKNTDDYEKEIKKEIKRDNMIVKFFKKINKN